YYSSVFLLRDFFVAEAALALSQVSPLAFTLSQYSSPPCSAKVGLPFGESGGVSPAAASAAIRTSGAFSSLPASSSTRAVTPSPRFLGSVSRRTAVSVFSGGSVLTLGAPAGIGAVSLAGTPAVSAGMAGSSVGATASAAPSAF